MCTDHSLTTEGIYIVGSYTVLVITFLSVLCVINNIIGKAWEEFRINARAKGDTYAVNTFLDGSETLDSLRESVQLRKDFDHYSDFDKGIEDFIKNGYIRLGTK